MKLVIDGKVTAERLIDILRIVAAEHGDRAELAGFYETTIVLRAYDKDGLPIQDLYEHEPNSQRIFETPRGEPRLPAFSEKGRKWIRENWGTDEEIRAKLIAQGRARILATHNVARTQAEIKYQVSCDQISLPEITP